MPSVQQLERLRHLHAFLRCPPPLPIHAIPILLILPTPILPIQAEKEAPNPQSRKHSAVAGTSRSGRPSTYGQRVRVAKSPQSPSPAPREKRIRIARDPSAVGTAILKAVGTAKARDPSASPPKKRLVDAAETMARNNIARARRKEPAAVTTGKVKFLTRRWSKIKAHCQKTMMRPVLYIPR